MLLHYFQEIVGANERDKIRGQETKREQEATKSMRRPDEASRHLQKTLRFPWSEWTLAESAWPPPQHFGTIGRKAWCTDRQQFAISSTADDTTFRIAPQLQVASRRLIQRHDSFDREQRNGQK